jgi:hypothetical protein
MAYLNCLPPNCNWSIIFGSGAFWNTIELSDVSKELDGTYRLNPTNPSVMSWSGGGDQNWPKERERIITETKEIMVKNVLRAGVSRWISNAYKFLESKHIIEEYKEQFPQTYSYLIYEEQIPYEKMNRIHYEIVGTITECINSKQVIDKKNQKEKEQIIKAKKIIDFYKKKDFECNKLFLEIELNYMKTPELYEKYFILKNLKNIYNPNNRVYDILYNTSISDIFITSYAKKLINMSKTNDIKFLEYLDKEKIKCIQDLLEKANPKNNLLNDKNVN